MKVKTLLIKGTVYYQSDPQALKDNLSIKQPLFLVEEKQNKYDINAIQIWGFIAKQEKVNATLLGYIPRNRTQFINFLKKHNLIKQSELCQIEKPNQQIELKICIYYSLSWRQELHYYWWKIWKTLNN